MNSIAWSSLSVKRGSFNAVLHCGDAVTDTTTDYSTNQQGLHQIEQILNSPIYFFRCNELPSVGKLSGLAAALRCLLAV
jgi:hypothetical protein